MTNEVNIKELKLQVLEALYNIYKLNVNDIDTLKNLDKTAWLLAFALKFEDDAPFHSLAELIEGTIAHGPTIASSGGRYVDEVEDAIKLIELK